MMRRGSQGLAPVSASDANRRTSLAGGALRVSKPEASQGKMTSSNRTSSMGRGRQSVGASGRPSAGGRASVGGARTSNAGPVTSRPSLSSRRTSTSATSNRRSSAFGKGAVKVRDPRPLSDKAFMTANIRTLIEHLAATGYNHPLSPKLLTTPTSKDFVRIFRFLYSQLDPHFKFGPKFEDEIPMLFKRLHYPFTISKSSLFAVGSIHTWPFLLASLTWMVELNRAFGQMDLKRSLWGVAGTGFEGEERLTEEQVFFEYVAGAYQAFLAGNDASTEPDNALKADWTRRHEHVIADARRLEQSAAAMMEELEGLKNRPSDLEVARKRKQDLIGDREKFKTLLQNLAAHTQAHERKHAATVAEHDAVVQELGEVLAEQARLEVVLSNQEMSSADVERINADRAKLEDNLRVVAQQKEQLDKLCWEREMQVSKRLEEMERLVHEHNQRGEEMHLIPLSAKHADGVDYELRVNFNAPRPDQMLSVDLKGVIKPALAKLKARLMAELHEVEEQRLGAQERLDQVADMVFEKQDELAILENKLRKLEDTYQEEKDKLSEQHRSRASELDEVEQEVQRLRMAAQAGLQESQRELEQARFQLEEQAKRCRAEKSQYNRHIVKTLELLTTHKAYLGERCKNLVEFARGQELVLARDAKAAMAAPAKPN